MKHGHLKMGVSQCFGLLLGYLGKSDNAIFFNISFQIWINKLNPSHGQLERLASCNQEKTIKTYKHQYCTLLHPGTKSWRIFIRSLIFSLLACPINGTFSNHLHMVNWQFHLTNFYFIEFHHLCDKQFKHDWQ